MFAYCYASGLIQFGRHVPRGALPIAKGPAKPLRDFIDPLARHGYRTHRVKGRPTKIAGTDCLLVPGIPEAPNQSMALDALARFTRWIKDHAPQHVEVIVGANAAIVKPVSTRARAA